MSSSSIMFNIVKLNACECVSRLIPELMQTTTHYLLLSLNSISSRQTIKTNQTTAIVNSSATVKCHLMTME